MNVLLYFIIFAAFVVMFTLEVIAPASGNSCDKRWQIYAGLLSGVQVFFTLLAGILFDGLFREHAWFSFGRELPAPVSGILSFLIASFIAYWWHRAMHKSDLLWRVFHQLHHSPSRVESLTSFYMHPFDGMAATLINAMSAYLIVGADVEGAAWALLFAGLYNLYIHVDLQSPHWLGYFIQRPEMHRVHHKRDHHADNYGLPIWDLLFGTFFNPKSRVHDVGFDAVSERRIHDMLRLRDVTKARELSIEPAE